MFVITTSKDDYITEDLQTTSSFNEAAQFNTKVGARLMSKYVLGQAVKIVKL